MPAGGCTTRAVRPLTASALQDAAACAECVLHKFAFVEPTIVRLV